jgi:hypothetical protein
MHMAAESAKADRVTTFKVLNVNFVLIVSIAYSRYLMNDYIVVNVTKLSIAEHLGLFRARYSVVRLNCDYLIVHRCVRHAKEFK